jgi:hypothetical protein
MRSSERVVYQSESVRGDPFPPSYAWPIALGAAASRRARCRGFRGLWRRRRRRAAGLWRRLVATQRTRRGAMAERVMGAVSVAARRVPRLPFLIARAGLTACRACALLLTAGLYLHLRLYCLYRAFRVCLHRFGCTAVPLYRLPASLRLDRALRVRLYRAS